MTSLSPLHVYLLAGKALFAPPYTEIIDVDAMIDLPLGNPVWPPAPAQLTRISPSEWYHTITFTSVDANPEDRPFVDAADLFQSVGRLILAKYMVEGRRMAFGPRRVQSFDKAADGHSYTLRLTWPNDVITHTEPPEILKYGFRMKGETKVDFIYQTDRTGRAAMLMHVDQVVQSPAQRDARERLLYEWLKTITEALLHI